MEGFKSIGDRGYYGMLVFVRKVKNIIYDDEYSTEKCEYEEKLESGFILEISKHFDGYYLVKYFTGGRVFHWGDDLFERNEEKRFDIFEK